jgi:hypothetical protein
MRAELINRKLSVKFLYKRGCFREGATVEVEVFQKKGDLNLKERLLKPAWLKEFREDVGAHRAFIWGKAPRHPI